MPSDRPAIAPPAPPAGPRSATAEPPISAAEPGAGATPSATCSRCRPSIRRGSTPCPTTSRKAPPPSLPAWVHRHLPRPSLRATPRALRYGRGSLLCTTRISPILRSQRGRDWTRKGGHVWTRIDSCPRSTHSEGSSDHNFEATHAASASAAYASRRASPHAMQGSLPAGWLTFTGRELNPLDRDERFQNFMFVLLS